MKLKFVKSMFYFSVLPRILQAFNLMDENTQYVLELKQFREKRSLSANSYYWILVDKISQVIHLSKDEVHERQLQKYGIFYIDKDGDILAFKTKKHVEIGSQIHCKLVKQHNGFYYYYVIRGSSTYDSKEMHCLIEGTIEDAKELGIDTMTPQELERLRYE